MVLLEMVDPGAQKTTMAPCVVIEGQRGGRTARANGRAHISRVDDCVARDDTLHTSDTQSISPWSTRSC